MGFCCNQITKCESTQESYEGNREKRHAKQGVSRTRPKALTDRCPFKHIKQGLCCVRDAGDEDPSRFKILEGKGKYLLLFAKSEVLNEGEQTLASLSFAAPFFQEHRSSTVHKGSRLSG